MAAKKKRVTKKVVPDHGWHGIGSGKPPFAGAAPPIHLHHGGKYFKGKKGKKK